MELFELRILWFIRYTHNESLAPFAQVLCNRHTVIRDIYQIRHRTEPMRKTLTRDELNLIYRLDSKCLEQQVTREFCPRAVRLKQALFLIGSCVCSVLF